MDDKEVCSEDGCEHQVDGNKEYRGEDRTATRRNTRRTAARRTAATRSTAVRTAVARLPGQWQEQPQQGGGPRLPTTGRARRLLWMWRRSQRSRVGRGGDAGDEMPAGFALLYL